MVKKNACVFISGQGSNLKNLIQRSRDNSFPIKIKLIISSDINANGIIYAKKNSIPYLIINTKLRNYENQILRNLNKHNISFICLAGYMKIISKFFIDKFRKNIINIHPSLLPKYGGKGMYGSNIHKAVIKNKELESGISIHFVNQNYDEGQIILQKKCSISANESVETLIHKIHKLEHNYFPVAIEKTIKKLYK